MNRKGRHPNVDVVEDTMAEGPKKTVVLRYMTYTDYYLQSIRGWNKSLLLGILLLYFVPCFMDNLWPAEIKASEKFERLLTVFLVVGSWILSISFLLMALLIPSSTSITPTSTGVNAFSCT